MGNCFKKRRKSSFYRDQSVFIPNAETRDIFCNFKISKSNKIIYYTNVYLTDPPEVGIRIGEKGTPIWFRDTEKFDKELDRLVKI